MPSRLTTVLRAAFRRRRFEDGLSEELRFHVDAYTDDLVRSGVTPGEARRRARLEFGNLDNVRSDCRHARRLGLLDALTQDLRQGSRVMARTPVLSATAIGIVAICVGANLALFGVVDAVLFRPLPFPDSDRLVRVFNTYPKAGVPDDGVSLTNYYERRGRLPALPELAIVHEGASLVGPAGATSREPVAWVSPGFFATLRAPVAAGRAFTEAETLPGADRVAILTDGYRQEAFGSAADVLGHRVRVDGVDRVVIGVLPPGFRFLSSQTRLYLPLASAPAQRAPERRHWGSQAQMIGRLAPGATLGEAQAQVDAHNAAVEKDGPDAKAMAEAGFRSLVVPLRADHVASVRPMLLLVQAGAVCLLGIGLVNLVNLLLIRAAGRAREFAIRQAIGASRRHVVGEALVETALVVVPGALLGTALGAAGVGVLGRIGADRLPLGADVAFDGRALLVAAAAAVAAVLLVAAPVAWYALRAHDTGGLHAQTRTSTTSRATLRLRHAFLVTQLALAFVLLSGAGLLAVSLAHVMHLPAGFRAEHVLSGQLTLPWKDYPDANARLSFAERLLDALGQRPGLSAPGISTNVPFSGNAVRSAATVMGHVPAPGEAPHGIYSYGVSGEYFEAMGIPLREGRYLETADGRRSVRACVVDEAFARRTFPAGRALGQRLFMGGQPGRDDEAFTIVGVVGAAKQAALTEDGSQGAVYYPYPYRDDNAIYVVARTAGAPGALAATLRAAVRDIDPDVAVDDVRPMDARMDDTLLARRSPALLAVAFAAIALLLTTIGTYGVLGHAVAQRRREIGVRIALGARPGQVRAQFLRLAARLLLAGVTVGLAGAWAAGRVMQSMLVGIPALHVPTLAIACAVLVVTALAATVGPSSRASKVTPTEVLAEE